MLAPALPSTTTSSSWSHGRTSDTERDTQKSTCITYIQMVNMNLAVMELLLVFQSGMIMSLHTATVSATWWPTWLPRSKKEPTVTVLCHIAHILLTAELYIYNNNLYHLWPCPISSDRRPPLYAWGKIRQRANKNVWPIFFFFIVPVLYLCEVRWRCERPCLQYWGTAVRVE